MWLSTKKDHHSEYNKFLTNELHTILSIGWSQAYGTRQYDGKATEKIRMHVRCLRVIKKSIQCYITLLHYIGANDRFHVFPAAFQKVLAGHWMAFQWHTVSWWFSKGYCPDTCRMMRTPRESGHSWCLILIRLWCVLIPEVALMWPSHWICQTTRVSSDRLDGRVRMRVDDIFG